MPGDLLSNSDSTIIIEEFVNENGETSCKKYIKGNFLGKGGFAKCYELTDLQTNELFAVKIISKSSLIKPRARQKLKSEIKIHMSMSHDRIVKFYKHFEDKENIYIVLELCRNKSLNDMVKRRKRLKEIEAKCYIAQIVDAMRYLKNHKVIHRDLKLGNLFLNDKMEVKVGDFGLAAKIEYDGERKRTICGTPNYIAPEVLSSRIGHSFEVDLWSLGVIAYTMLYGRPPFETKDVKMTYKRIKNNNYTFPQHVQVSESSKDFIKCLLRTDPLKRMPLDTLMTHEFFTNYPDLMPVSTLSCPPSTIFIEKYISNPDIAPKPGVSPGKVQLSKDIATFECDLYDNDEAQIISNRQASVQSHRRMESQEKFFKFNRAKDTVSNDRQHLIKTERNRFVNTDGKLKTSSPNCSPKKCVNYLHINLAKYDDCKDENEDADSEKKQFNQAELNLSSDKNIGEVKEIEFGKTESKKITPEKQPKVSSISVERASYKGICECEKALISKWIDYSSKYGMGYQLSNGIFGVLFNDSTKIIVSKDNYQFCYLKRESSNKINEDKENIDNKSIPVYDFNNYPDDLK